MATIKKIQKAQAGADVPKGMVRGERSEGKLYKKEEADKWGKGMSDAMDRQAGVGKYAPKKAATKTVVKVSVKKAKNGASFPDLNKDGKITKADVLKGRGVIAKKGAKIAKKAMPCASCGKSMKKK